MNERDVLAALGDIAVETLGVPRGDLDESANLLELGLDSLMLIKFGQKIEHELAVKLEMAWFFKNMPTLATLAAHVASLGGTRRVAVPHAPERSPETNAPASTPVQTTGEAAADMTTIMKDIPLSAGSVAGGDLASLFKMQTDALEALFDRQLALIESGTAVHAPSKEKKRSIPPVAHDIRGFRLADEEGLTAEQEAFIDKVVAHHVERTRKSRAITQEHRRHLADWKNSLSFRARLKDAIYPIVADGSNGARFTDVDGNNYIDIALGMGVNYMGHKNPTIVKAVERRLEAGFELGPQCNMTGIAAEKVARLTGMERVCFCNTGSEAVMIGLRLARAKSGRTKIALFNGAYHGIFDGVLGVVVGDEVHPLSPGTPPGMVDDIVMLDYDSPASLEKIEAMADELAAVLVEPVQSRRPGLQPQTFLRKLRRLTRENGVALIFDEMVNGFRIAPGGAQEHFGIRADIALYGKTIGGGLPVGVIAGKAEYLDFIDGGYFQFGDDSLPGGNAIVFGGTFCRHPFAMEAVNAVADYMLSEGPALQERVNRLAAMLADECNLWFQDEQVPLRIARFGSQFKFDSFGPWSPLANPLELDLFFMQLVDAGIYVWERRTCCLSVFHTEDDIRTIIGAIKNAVTRLREGGFPFRMEHGAPEQFHEVASVQKRIFAAMQRENGQAPYHMPAAWRITGDLDIDRLECAIGEIIKRHECLRSGFRIAGGRLLRIVVEEPRFFIEHIDPKGRTPETIVADFLRPFDLEQPPLVRVGIAPLGNGSSLLVFDSLHIVVDGIALATFTQELNAFFNGSEPPALGATYSQYERFMRAFEAGDDCARHRAFWTEALKDAPEPVSFPRRKESAEQPLSTAHVRSALPMETMADIRKTAAACGVTPYMFLLAVYASFLRSLAGTKELVVGVATTGRPEERFETTVGMFVNTIPLRLLPEGDTSFKDYLKHVREVCADAFEHQDIPYELITEETGDTVGTMFTYEVADERSLALSGLDIEEMVAPIPGAMFDFSLDAIEKNGTLHLDFEFDTRVAEEPNVHIWAMCFADMIGQVCANPSIPLKDIRFRSSANDSFRLTGGIRDYGDMSTVLDLFDHAAASNPKAAAVIDGEGTMSYADLAMRSRHIAHLLAKEYGIGPETLTAVAAPPSAAVVAIIMGILRAGGAFLPLEHDAPSSRTNRILETADITLLITDRDSIGGLQGARRTASVEDIVIKSCGQPLYDSPEPDPRSLAYVIYTSGSTGFPKGCEIEHASLLNYLAWAIAFYFPDGGAGNFSLTSPLAFDMSLMTLFVPLCLGKTLRIPARGSNPAEALALALSPETETDVLNLTPSHVRMIGELGIGKTNARIAVVGGESLRPEDVASLLRLNPSMKIYNEYGPTEATIGCTAKEIVWGEFPMVGKPIFNTTAHILDADGRTLPPGAWGELAIGGAGLARGYRGRPDLTAERFITGADVERLYRTGDLARITAIGDIELSGRIDDQIKIGGHRIEPGEIESALMACEGVDKAAVVFDGVLIACVAGKCDAATVKESVAGLLPVYMVPQRIVIIDSIPILSSGKTDRKRLMEMVCEAGKTETGSDEQDIPVSKALTMLRAIARNGTMGPSDNFFAAGGNSLDAIAVVARCRAELGIDVGLREFFASPTADTIDRSPAARGHSRSLSHTSALDGIPQTSGQQQIWLASRKSGSAYNMTETFVFEGALDTEKLKASFEELVRHHEILRTTFREANGTLLQDVRPFDGKCLHFETGTLSGDVGVIEQAVIARANREACFTFDLAGGPLMRIVLLSTGTNRHYCILNIHHIITDGWSAALMLEEVSRIYRDGGKVDLPSWQYRDFAAWHAGYIEGAEGERDLTYWKSVLRPPLERVSLPGRKDGNSSGGRHSARPAETVDLVIEPSLIASLESLARANGATLFMTLIAGLAAVLHQRTSSGDIVIGTPSAGRLLPELETMPGYFLNTLPLRMRFGGGTRFDELVRIAAECASGAFARQLYPFDHLAEQIDSGRSDGRNPLFDVMLILQNTADYRFDLTGVRSRRFYSPRAAEAKFELMIELETAGDRLAGVIEYDASLYDKAVVTTLASDYVKTLKAAVKSPESPVSSLFKLLSGESDVSREGFLKSIAVVSEDF